MAEITAVAMTEVLSSNISDDKLIAIFTFKTITGEEHTIAMPMPQLVPMIELATMELQKSELGVDAAALEATKCQVEKSDDPERFALTFETPNGGRLAHKLKKGELPGLLQALQALEND